MAWGFGTVTAQVLFQSWLRNWNQDPVGLVKGAWLQITGRVWAVGCGGCFTALAPPKGERGRGLQPAGGWWAGTCGRHLLLPGEGVYQLVGRSLRARQLLQWLLGGGGGPLA